MLKGLIWNPEKDRFDAILDSVINEQSGLHKVTLIPIPLAKQPVQTSVGYGE